MGHNDPYEMLIAEREEVIRFELISFMRIVLQLLIPQIGFRAFDGLYPFILINIDVYVDPLLGGYSLFWEKFPDTRLQTIRNCVCA